MSPVQSQANIAVLREICPLAVCSSGGRARLIIARDLSWVHRRPWWYAKVGELGFWRHTEALVAAVAALGSGVWGLAQKLALETDEQAALAVANRHSGTYPGSTWSQLSPAASDDCRCCFNHDPGLGNLDEPAAGGWRWHVPTRRRG